MFCILCNCMASGVCAWTESALLDMQEIQAYFIRQGKTRKPTHIQTGERVKYLKWTVSYAEIIQLWNSEGLRYCFSTVIYVYREATALRSTDQPWLRTPWCLWLTWSRTDSCVLEDQRNTPIILPAKVYIKAKTEITLIYTQLFVQTLIIYPNHVQETLEVPFSFVRECVISRLVMPHWVLHILNHGSGRSL